MASPLKTPVSPKVTSGGNAAFIATLLLALLSSVDQNSLAALGPTFEPIAVGVVVGGTFALRAYLKEDSLRTVGAQAEQAKANQIVQTVAANAPAVVQAVEPFIPAAAKSFLDGIKLPAPAEPEAPVVSAPAA